MNKKVEFLAEGTTCKSCEKIIIKQANKVKGVKEAHFDYSKETGTVTFDDEVTDIDEILYKIEEKGYACYLLENKAKGKSGFNKKIGLFFGILGFLVAAFFLFNFVEGINMPQISQNMGYGLLFAVGLLTGFHCISMCGGFVVGYTTKCADEGVKPHKAHLMYAVGKTISYTIIGALFGLLGSFIAFTPALRGMIGIFAGLFLLLFGLKMLNIIPALRKINFTTPKFILRFVGKQNKKASSPLAIGLLNGLMLACGPLQAIYVMAAGTGSMMEGAKLLFIFGLGTLPVMIGFGYFVSFVSGKVTHRILKLSGALVIIMGIFMINNGLSLTGTGYDLNSVMTGITAASAYNGPADNNGGQLEGNSPIKIVDGFQEIRMEVNRYGWTPDTFVLKKGVPVKWIIDGKEINGCNNAIQVPKYNLNFPIKQGEQIIEFTPTENGQVSWSCWMGMIPGMFIVKDDIDVGDLASIKAELDNAPELKAGSCGMGGSGGCGCGGGA